MLHNKDLASWVDEPTCPLLFPNSIAIRMKNDRSFKELRKALGGHYSFVE